jgi:hypothetical protein
MLVGGSGELLQTKGGVLVIEIPQILILPEVSFLLKMMIRTLLRWKTNLTTLER